MKPILLAAFPGSGAFFMRDCMLRAAPYLKARTEFFDPDIDSDFYHYFGSRRRWGPILQPSDSDSKFQDFDPSYNLFVQTLCPLRLDHAAEVFSVVLIQSPLCLTDKDDLLAVYKSFENAKFEWASKYKGAGFDRRLYDSLWQIQRFVKHKGVENDNDRAICAYLTLKFIFGYMSRALDIPVLSLAAMLAMKEFDLSVYLTDLAADIEPTTLAQVIRNTGTPETSSYMHTPIQKSVEWFIRVHCN